MRFVEHPAAQCIDVIDGEATKLTRANCPDNGLDGLVQKQCVTMDDGFCMLRLMMEVQPPQRWKLSRAHDPVGMGEETAGHGQGIDAAEMALIHPVADAHRQALRALAQARAQRSKRRGGIVIIEDAILVNEPAARAGVKERMVGERVEGMWQVKINVLAAAHALVDVATCRGILGPPRLVRCIALAKKRYLRSCSEDAGFRDHWMKYMDVAFREGNQFPHRNDVEGSETDDDRSRRTHCSHPRPTA